MNYAIGGLRVELTWSWRELQSAYCKLIARYVTSVY